MKRALVFGLFVICSGCSGASPTAPEAVQANIPVNPGEVEKTIVLEVKNESPPILPPPSSIPGSWSDDFSGGRLSPHWMATLSGGWGFDADHVDLSHGMLGLRLTQTPRSDGRFNSIGGEVQSRERFGFGTYTWVVRSSSTAQSPNAVGSALSGSATGIFTYFSNSETEIDFEVEGKIPHLLHLVTWTSGKSSSFVDVVLQTDVGFHEYKFSWYPDRIERFVDGVLVFTQKNQIPQTPGYVMMNHWGTCCPGWGGLPTEGTRYVWVRSFSYTPNP